MGPNRINAHTTRPVNSADPGSKSPNTPGDAH
jgi:hypothetical protein